MELLADRDPEEARQILDPVLEHMMAKPRHDLLYASASFPRLDFSQSKLPRLRGHQWLTMLPYTTSCSVLDAR